MQLFQLTKNLVLQVLFVLFTLMVGVESSQLQAQQIVDEIANQLKRATVSEKVILKWLSEHISVSGAADKRPSLFRRRQAVRADINLRYLEPAADIINEQARLIVETMSDAYGLSISHTSQDANLLVISAANIADGDKPKKEILRRIGLEDRLASIVYDAGGWGEGCGGYHFGDGSGTIKLSFIVADVAKLNASAMRDCVATGVVRAFGIKAKYNAISAGPTGHVPYVILGRLLHACSAELQDIERSDKLLQSRYVYCVFSKLQAATKQK